MNIEFQSYRAHLPVETGRRQIPGFVNFSSPVQEASVVLAGFKLDYANEDHHIRVIEADADIVRIRLRTVIFQVECNFADKDGDDPYSGYVDLVVMAKVEA